MANGRAMLKPKEVLDKWGTASLLMLVQEGRVDPIEAADEVSDRLEAPGRRAKRFLVRLSQAIFH